MQDDRPISPPAAPGVDALTGLADRQAFGARLAALCADAADTALLMVDLDRFRLVNDLLGRPAGDALLRLVADRLRAILRSADVIGRSGGDEFAIAIPAGADVTAVAERIVAILGRPYLVDRRSTVISANIGIAIAPLHATRPAELIRAAEIALDRAKSDGRGAVRMFDAELDQRLRVHDALADDLRRAIPLRQLELDFQPQVCLETGALTGFEALVRWRHPERGRLSPDQFIPLAEAMGLIVPLGRFVLREACRQAVRWPVPPGASPVTVAVNVSPTQLLDPDRLPELVASTLAATGLAPQRLEIEITETALLREAEALVVLHAIRALGVRVSMDDFGTGYSSLSQLRRFPFDKLKIDRSFVRDLGTSVEAASVVRAISALGRSLGMTTVAEGVETPAQAAICRADGCSTIQGFLVSRPVPAEHVADLIHRLANPAPEALIDG